MKIAAVVLCILMTGCGTMQIVQSRPAGAAVWIDGRDTGKTTPARIRLRHLTSGAHAVTVRKEGYESISPPQTLKVRTAAGRVLGSVVFIVPAFFELIGDQWKEWSPRRLDTFYLRMNSMLPTVPASGSEAAANQ